MRSTAACLFLASMFLVGVAGAAESQLDVFQRRIAPILASKNASSCSECHLSGVDLKAYIDPDPTKTFAALRAAGLIDVKNPRKSKLLEFIAREPEKPRLVTQKIRQEEYEAFAAWIEVAVKDPKLAAAKADAKLGPELPVEVLRHARRDRVLASFVDNVWSEVGRCAACHSPDRNQEQVKKHGAQVSWITLGDPQATLDHMVEHDLIDVHKPSESLLLQKPTNQVKHGGGVKMTIGDRTYQQFAAFITDYSKSKAGEYQTAKDLPVPRAEISTVSDVWLKITDVPAELDQLLLRAEVYPWDARNKNASSELYATGDRQVFGKGKLWQQHLTLVAPRDSKRAKQLALPPGKYVVRIYVDRENKLAKQVATSLGKDEFVGEVPIEAQWPAGYGQMTVVRFPASR